MTNPCSILKEFIWKHCICVLVLVAVAFAAANYKAVFAWLSYEFGNNLWNILTAIGTLTAAVVAYYALNQAKRNAERATFDQYFSQRLSSIRETVFDERLSKKTIFYRYKGSDGQKKEQQSIKELLSGDKVPKCDLYGYDTWDMSTFKTFVHGIIESQEIQGLSTRGLRKYWEVFCNRLAYNAEFQLCFGVIYNAIEFVHHSNQPKDVKQEYIGILSRSLSRDVLFCYMISLFDYHNASPSEYGNILKSYGFFHELFADKEYQKIIKDALPHDIFALFNNK